MARVVSNRLTVAQLDQGMRKTHLEVTRSDREKSVEPVAGHRSLLVQADLAKDQGVALVRHTILATALESVLGCSSRRPLGVVAAGSLARGEETILVHEGRVRVLGDAEFYVIFRTPSEAKEFRSIIDRVLAEIERALMSQGIECPVSIAVPSRTILRRLPPHIMGFELRTTGKVIWGDPGVLGLIPPCAPQDIPKWDAWRSVANRMIEQLACADALACNEPGRLSDLLYRCLKLQLELATMVLHFHGAYQPTYRQRAEGLKQLQTSANYRKALPWLAELASRVEACTQFKLDPASPSPYRDAFTGVYPAEKLAWFVREECCQVLSLVRSIWLWGAGRLLKRELDDTPDVLSLSLRIARRQDWHWRLRGWARLIFVDSSWRGSDFWGRWPRLVRIGSPRFLVYAVAAALYFAWADWLDGDSTAADAAAGRASRYFPYPDKTADRDNNWLDLKNAVVAAWDRFLKTRWE